MRKYTTTKYTEIKNPDTKKVIKINLSNDKIVILKPITAKDFENAKQDYRNYLEASKNNEEDVRHLVKNKIKTFDKSINDKTIKELFPYYFIDDNATPYNRTNWSIFFYFLANRNLILLPLFQQTDDKTPFSFSQNIDKEYIFKNSQDTNNFNAFMYNYKANFQEKHKTYYTVNFKMFQSLYFSSNIRTIKAINPELSIKIIEEYKKINKGTPAEKRLSTLVSGLRLIGEYHEDFFKDITWLEEFNIKAKKEYNNGKYLFLNEFYETKSIKEKWVIYANEFINTKRDTIKRIDRFARSISEWFNYLIDNNYNHLLPEEIIRKEHIKDVSLKNKNTFFERILNMKGNNNTKNAILFHISEFFVFIKDEYVNDMILPILNKDKINTQTKNTITTRKRVPISIINTAKEMLLENNNQLNRDFQNEHTSNIIKVDKQGNDIYWYGYTYIMYILLFFPIRHKQARWLDSGELDEFIIDFETMEYVKNDNQYAIKGRRECCLQIEIDYFTNKKYFSFYINTNKTGNDYKIPYVPNDIIEMIKKQLEWNKKYGKKLTKPIVAAEQNKEMMELGNSEMVVPLFLYPAAKRGSVDNAVREGMTKYFFNHLLYKTQNKIKESTGQEIELVKSLDKFEKSAFDIHSLRVSGITNLIEAGVPVEIVSQFIAGHASTVMTLYYNKNSVEEISSAISKIHNKNVNLQDELEAIKSFEEFDNKLFSSNFEFNESSYKVFEENKQFWNIGLSGICTVNCETDGRQDKCCAKCNYWITGSPFLVGQVAEINNLMYSIRKKSETLRELKIKSIENGSAQLKGQIERLNEELYIMIEEWTIRYKFVFKSFDILEEKVDNETKPSLLSSSSIVDIKNTLKLGQKEESNFGIAAYICDNIEIIDEFDNTAAQQELEIFISKILINNDIEPFLLKLDKQKSLESSNLFAKYILNNYSNLQIEELINGNIALENNNRTEIENLFQITNKNKKPKEIIC